MISGQPPPCFPFSDPNALRLPGLAPLDMADWIASFSDLEAQLAYRDHLIRVKRPEVIMCLPEGAQAAGELMETVVAHLADLTAWKRKDNAVQRPGGALVPLDRDDPLGCVGRLVSEDFCLLTKPMDGSEYRLVASVLCFPAHWSLSEKMGCSLSEIHTPVPTYSSDVALRVNRVFAAIRPDQILMRYNWGLARQPELHAPQSARLARPGHLKDAPCYLRTERQTFRRLPRTGAIAFGIRTTLTALSVLSQPEATALLQTLRAQSDQMTRYKGGAPLFDAAERELVRSAMA